VDTQKVPAGVVVDMNGVGGGGTSSGFNSPASSNSGASLYHSNHSGSSGGTDLWQTAIQSSILGIIVFSLLQAGIEKKKKILNTFFLSWYSQITNIL
jgi:hypothetical protein